MKIESHELFNRICDTLKIKGLNEECSRATVDMYFGKDNRVKCIVPVSELRYVQWG